MRTASPIVSIFALSWIIAACGESGFVYVDPPKLDPSTQSLVVAGECTDGFELYAVEAGQPIPTPARARCPDEVTISIVEYEQTLAQLYLQPGRLTSSSADECLAVPLPTASAIHSVSFPEGSHFETTTRLPPSVSSFLRLTPCPCDTVSVEVMSIGMGSSAWVAPYDETRAVLLVVETSGTMTVSLVDETGKIEPTGTATVASFPPPLKGFLGVLDLKRAGDGRYYLAGFEGTVYTFTVGGVFEKLPPNPRGQPIRALVVPTEEAPLELYALSRPLGVDLFDNGSWTELAVEEDFLTNDGFAGGAWLGPGEAVLFPAGTQKTIWIKDEQSTPSLPWDVFRDGSIDIVDGILGYGPVLATSIRKLYRWEPGETRAGEWVALNTREEATPSAARPVSLGTFPEGLAMGCGAPYSIMRHHQDWGSCELMFFPEIGADARTVVHLGTTLIAGSRIYALEGRGDQELSIVIVQYER